MSSKPSVHPSDREAVQIVKGMPLPLKDAIVDRAEATQSNMNDVAVSILANALKVHYRGGSGRRSSRQEISNSTTVTLYMPSRLHFRIRERALKEHTTARALVIRVLSDELLGGAAAA